MCLLLKNKMTIKAIRLERLLEGRGHWIGEVTEERENKELIHQPPSLARSLAGEDGGEGKTQTQSPGVPSRL